MTRVLDYRLLCPGDLLFLVHHIYRVAAVGESIVRLDCLTAPGWSTRPAGWFVSHYAWLIELGCCGLAVDPFTASPQEWREWLLER